MALESGTRFGPYEVVEQIGSGGMGEVYRATDSGLDRDVALKILPDSFASDPDRVARFEQEAKTLASLNHPNIAQIYGLERSDDATAIVMELVEGPTLADRIAEGPIPRDEAVGIAMQITSALEAAHERHIVHRDLKPANVKLRLDGTVKVLDFGIAKAFEPETLISGSGSPVLTTPATQAGVILGTAAYMSPEQAKGKTVDKRTDVWAFGCVLYEMLTGQLAFGGEDVATTLARVIANETDMNSLPAEIPPAVRRTLELCLQKDPNKRVRDIGDVGLALSGSFATTPLDEPNTDAAAQFPWRSTLSVLVAVIVTAIAVWLVALGQRSEAPITFVNRFTETLPQTQAFQTPRTTLLDVSRDGRKFVYVTSLGLYVRDLDDRFPRLISGTESQVAVSPAISADGQSVIYFDGGGNVQRISTNGGTPIVLANWTVQLPPTATWSGDGTIFYSAVEGIFRLAATGGVPELVIPAESDERMHRPQVLPGGGSVLFSVTRAGWDQGQVVVQSLATGDRTEIVSGGTDGRYLPSGHVVYTTANTIFALGFDPETLTTLSAGVPVLQGVMRSAQQQAAAQFAVAADGTLIYIPEGGITASERSLVWLDRNGSESSLGLESRNFTYARVSPDGRRIASSINDGGNSLWVTEISRPVLSLAVPLVAAPGSVTWSGDSQELIFAEVQEGGGRSIGSRLADGTGEIETLLVRDDVPFVSPGGLTPDGDAMVFTYGRGSAQPSIGVLSLVSNEDAQNDWQPLIDRVTGASAASVSPDGEWVAYHTDDTGQYGVYIERFPELSGRELISDADGGWGARWSTDGTEIFYRRLGDGAMMAVGVEVDPTLVLSTPEMLFETQGRGYIPLVTPAAGGGSALSWDLAPDGRFLMIKEGGLDTTSRREIVIVQNWLDELERLVPTD